MEKKITITEANGKLDFINKGFTPIEVIGLLRHYENIIHLEMLKKMKKVQNSKTK